MIRPSEAAAWAAMAGKIAANTGPKIVTASSSSLRETTPKITPVMLPIPPTMSIPRNHTEFMKGKWSVLMYA
jgi:hypothetical protein